MKAKYALKTVFFMLLPFSLFLLLLYPYSLVNQSVIVDWLGCGCPKVNEAGEMVHDYFNANDFTAVFWAFIALCVTALSVIPGRRFLKGQNLLCAVYVIGVGGLSLHIARSLTEAMMWN